MSEQVYEHATNSHHYLIYDSQDQTIETRLDFHRHNGHVYIPWSIPYSNQFVIFFTTDAIDYGTDTELYETTMHYLSTHIDAPMQNSSLTSTTSH